MIEIEAGEITLGDIGCRVVVIDGTGNAYAGVLTDASATDWKYGERLEDKVRIRIKVKSGGGSAIELNALPLDFRLQIERGADPGTTSECASVQKGEGGRWEQG